MLNILAFFLLLAVATVTLYGIRLKENNTAVFLDKEEKSDSKVSGTDKEDFKVKAVRQAPDYAGPRITRSIYVLSHFFPEYTVYISLPELPPKRA